MTPLSTHGSHRHGGCQRQVRRAGAGSEELRVQEPGGDVHGGRAEGGGAGAERGAGGAVHDRDGEGGTGGERGGAGGAGRRRRRVGGGAGAAGGDGRGPGHGARDGGEGVRVACRLAAGHPRRRPRGRGCAPSRPPICIGEGFSVSLALRFSLIENRRLYAN